jgi:hypothetical protein
MIARTVWSASSTKSRTQSSSHLNVISVGAVKSKKWVNSLLFFLGAKWHRMLGARIKKRY